MSKDQYKHFHPKAKPLRPLAERSDQHLERQQVISKLQTAIQRAAQDTESNAAASERSLQRIQRLHEQTVPPEK